jgi:hypothetical protein
VTEPPPHRVHVWPWLRRPGSIFLRDWLAITLGGEILAWRALSATELAHELQHVRQWRRFGVTFPVRYLLAAWSARRAGRHWYRDNRFEVEARKAVGRG